MRSVCCFALFEVSSKLKVYQHVFETFVHDHRGGFASEGFENMRGVGCEGFRDRTK
jgi:hypothetical protein